MILDCHTHAFPDAIAERAMAALTQQCNEAIQPETDGTISGLLDLMDRHGVSRAVLASIATKPGQGPAILEWSLQVRSERILPFASIHPDTPDRDAEMEAILRSGLRGIKLHPLYQQFRVDDRRVFPLYDAIAESGLPVLMHAGYDIAFGDADWSLPQRFVPVLENFPRLRLILAHFGGWKTADIFLETLAGKDVWIDTSFADGFCTPAQRDEILRRHDTQRILFGSDSPWGGMAAQLRFVNELPVSDAVRERIFSENATLLLEG